MKYEVGKGSLKRLKDTKSDQLVHFIMGFSHIKSLVFTTSLENNTIILSQALSSSDFVTCGC